MAETEPASATEATQVLQHAEASSQPEPGSATEATQAPQDVGTSGSLRVYELHELRDMKGRTMRLNAKFLLHEGGSGPSRPRMLDYESNTRQVVFNPKNHDGLHLTLDKTFHPNTRAAFGIRWPGDGSGHWLLGNLSGTNDVVLGKNQLSSKWYFANESTDSYGHKCYEIWSWRTDIVGGGDVPIFLPVDSLARAGYDNDWEWRTYKYGVGAEQGFFKVKFELVD